MSQLPDSFPHPRDEDSHEAANNLEEVLAQIFDDAEREHSESGGLALAERNGDPQIKSELGNLAVNGETAADSEQDTINPLHGINQQQLFEGFDDESAEEESLEDQMTDELIHDGGVDIVPAAERYLQPGPDDESVNERLIYRMGTTKLAQESGQPVETLEDAIRLYRLGTATDEKAADRIKHADPVSLTLTPEEYHYLENALPPIPDDSKNS